MIVNLVGEQAQGALEVARGARRGLLEHALGGFGEQVDGGAIDQTFVKCLGRDPEDDRIVAAVVDLAATLGLRSIAEGVETDEQLTTLRALGCDQAQGYLFARPLPPGEIITAIQRSAR